jgi:hypothetical protein
MTGRRIHKCVFLSATIVGGYIAGMPVTAVFFEHITAAQVAVSLRIGSVHATLFFRFLNFFIILAHKLTLHKDVPQLSAFPVFFFRGDHQTEKRYHFNKSSP